eukprot:gene2981-3722_t
MAIHCSFMLMDNTIISIEIIRNFSLQFLLKIFKRIMTLIGTDIPWAAKLLATGEVLAIPTETVYGLAANIYDPVAVAKVFSIKQRPLSHPLIVHVGCRDVVDQFVKVWPPQAAVLTQHYWPGPLTLLLPKKDKIPATITAGSSQVAIRMPNHSLTLQLLQQLDFPLAAPSANPFGYVSPTIPEHVQDQLGGKIPYILDGGACRVGIESTIVGFEGEKTIIYRLGGLSVSAIEQLVGMVEVRNNACTQGIVTTPGSLASHYAPKKPLKIGNVPDLVREYAGYTVGILGMTRYYEGISQQQQFLLAPSGRLEEAASNLFAALRAMDQLAIDMILCDWVPHQGLGMAINDRLQRASVSR